MPDASKLNSTAAVVTPQPDMNTNFHLFIFCFDFIRKPNRHKFIYLLNANVCCFLICVSF